LVFKLLGKQGKKAFVEAHQSIKTTRVIVLFIFFSLFLVGSVNALGFDNVLSYEKDDRVVTFDNWFGLGATIARAELITPKVNRVIRGKDRKVMIWKVENFGNAYLNGLTDMEILNVNDKNKKVEKEFHYEYAIYEDFIVQDLEDICTQVGMTANGSIKTNCFSNIIGSHIETKINRWERFDTAEIPRGNITIALVTDVKAGDRFDGIPTLFGRKITKWAVWTENLNDQIFSYWRFDEGSGTNVLDAVNDNFNITLQNSPTWQGGLINNSIRLEAGLSQSGNTTINISIFGNNNWSIAVWANLTGITTSPSNHHILLKMGTTLDGIQGCTLDYDDGAVVWKICNLTIQTGTVPALGMKHHVITHNATRLSWYVNGTLINSTGAATLNIGSNVFFVGRDDVNVRFWNGTVDELGIWNRTLTASEINDLYNEGAGITFTSILVNLVAPPNNTNTTRDSFYFSANHTVSENTNFSNTTLFVWNSLDDSLFGTNSTNITGTSNSTNLSISGLLSNRSYLWNYRTCSSDSACSMAPTNNTLNVISIIQVAESFNNPVIESSIETFQLNVTLHTDRSISLARLVYNNTEAIPIITNPQDNDFTLTATATTPTVIAETNVPLFWNITLDNSQNFSSLNVTQIVSNISIDDCTSFTQVIMNLTVEDEELQTIITDSTIEISINISDASGQTSVAVFGANTTVNPFAVCLENQLPTGTTLSLSSIIKYSSPVHAIEYHNIVNFSLTNQTMAQNITLFDLNITDSTDFQLTFIGSDFLAVEDALVFVDRQYIPENTFKTVELPKTDSNGQAVLHLVRNDIIYNIRISKNGVILGNFENLIAFCEDFSIGDCEINLNAGSSTESLFNYDSALGITFTQPTFNNNTRIVSFSFLTSDGTSKTILMNVTRFDVFGNRTICEDTLLSASGSLSCTIPSNIDDADIIVNVYVNGNQTVFRVFKLDPTNFGVAGYLVFFVMAISVIFMFSGSKTGVLIGIIIAFAGAIGLGMISSDIIGLGASGLWLIIMVLVGIWKLNKERAQ